MGSPQHDSKEDTVGSSSGQIHPGGPLSPRASHGLFREQSPPPQPGSLGFPGTGRQPHRASPASFRMALDATTPESVLPLIAHLVGIYYFFYYLHF